MQWLSKYVLYVLESLLLEVFLTLPLANCHWWYTDKFYLSVALQNGDCCDCVWFHMNCVCLQLCASQRGIVLVLVESTSTLSCLICIWVMKCERSGKDLTECVSVCEMLCERLMTYVILKAKDTITVCAIHLSPLTSKLELIYQTVNSFTSGMAILPLMAELH